MGPQQFNGGVPNPYQNQMPQQFGPPNQQFNPTMMPNPNAQPYSNIPQVN
jgi:hypothetical protein